MANRSDHNHVHPDLPALVKDIDGNQDAEFVWDVLRQVWQENARLAAENQRLREKNFLAIQRYRRLRDRIVNYLKEKQQ